MNQGSEKLTDACHTFQNHCDCLITGRALSQFDCAGYFSFTRNYYPHSVQTLSSCIRQFHKRTDMG